MVRGTALAAICLLSLPIACGDDAASGGRDATATSNSASSSGQGGSGFVPSTTIREIPLGGLDGGQVSFDLAPNTLGAHFWLRSDSPYLLDLATSSRKIIQQSNWIRDGVESPLGVTRAQSGVTSLWTLASGHGDPLPSIADSYTLTAVQSETASIATAAAAQGTTIGASGPPHFDPAIVRVREGFFVQGAVDFNVFLPPGLAPQEEHMRQVLAQVMSDFGGLSLGNVDFHPISDDAMVLDSEEEIEALQKEIAVVTRSPSVSILVTSAFSPDGIDFGENLRGRSPLPGNPFVHGTPLDSLLVRISTDPAYDAIVVRHELGHYTGLFHTEEAIFGITDALDDTPDCVRFPDSCQNVTMCGCDLSNLMFPVVADASPRTLSPKQIKLVQGSLIYRDDATVAAQRRHVPAPSIRYADWSPGLSMASTRAVGAICGAPVPALTARDRRDLVVLAERTDVSPAIRRAALEAVGAPRTQDEHDRVIALVVAPGLPRDVRLGGVAVLGRGATDESRAVLVALEADPDDAVRAVAQAALGGAVD